MKNISVAKQKGAISSFPKPLWFTIRKHQDQIGGKEHWKIETCCL